MDSRKISRFFVYFFLTVRADYAAPIFLDVFFRV